MTTRLPHLSVYSRGRFATVSLLASALLALGWALLAPIPTANAGEWMQRSCSYKGEYIAPEGWAASVTEGYNPLPNEFCELGGGFAVYASPDNDDEPGAGQTWTYTAPHGSLIAGGTLNAWMHTRNGRTAIEAIVNSYERVQLRSCMYPNCEHYEGPVTLPADASQVSVVAQCIRSTEHPLVCEDTGSRWGLEDNFPFSGEANVTDPEIILSTNAMPKGSGFTGTLLHETISGTGTLDFTATDPGPGVYQVRVKIDGNQVLAETPNTNDGKCAPNGTSEGLRVFDSMQPCPNETPVRAEVQTASVSDGTHTLEVEDAAGNVSTVYTGPVTTLNHAITTTTSTQSTIAPPERGPCNGTPCEEAAKLTATPGEAKTFTRSLHHTPITLTGHLTSPTGAPIEDAQVKLLQKINGSSIVTGTASTTTNADGSWSLKAPPGPSRLLQVAFYSHTLDTIPASTLDFHENVHGAVSMHAPRRAGLGQTVLFTGHLAGGYVPAGGESVQIEIFYSGRWRTIEVLPTTSSGRWAYKYVFTLGVGTSYRFRTVTVPNGTYPFTPAASKPVRITVIR